MEPAHSAAKPGLRRVNAPVEVSSAYYEAMASSRMRSMRSARGELAGGTVAVVDAGAELALGEGAARVFDLVELALDPKGDEKGDHS